MEQEKFDALRLELSLKAKNGIDFITAATIVWTAITIIWTLDYTSYDRSVLTFIVGGVMLPLAFGLSRLFKTNWKIKNNPLDPLGLWLNFAQLFYFPFLVFILIKIPDYFLMSYVIITGAHFFPYAWFYQEIGFAIMAGVISVGSLIMALTLPQEQFFLIGLFMVVSLLVLASWIFLSYRKKLVGGKQPADSQ